MPRPSRPLAPDDSPPPRLLRRPSRVHFSDEDDSALSDSNASSESEAEARVLARSRPQRFQRAEPENNGRAQRVSNPGTPRASHRRAAVEGTGSRSSLDTYRSYPDHADMVSLRVSDDESDSPRSPPRRPSRLTTNAPSPSVDAGLSGRKGYAKPSPNVQASAQLSASVPGEGYGRRSSATGSRDITPLKSALSSRGGSQVASLARSDSCTSYAPADGGRPHRSSRVGDAPVPPYSPRRYSRTAPDEKVGSTSEEDEPLREKARLYDSPRAPRSGASGAVGRGRGALNRDFAFPGQALVALPDEAPTASTKHRSFLGIPLPRTQRRTTLELEAGPDEPSSPPSARARAAADRVEQLEERAANRADWATTSRSSFAMRGGVFSQLLRLSNGQPKMGKKRAFLVSNATGAGADEALPTMRTLGLRRTASIASQGWGDMELDDDDPRITGIRRKRRDRRHSMSELPFIRMMSVDGVDKQRQRTASIQLHVADILTRQSFILKLAKALMAFGAPSHRIESQLAATALVLEIDAQFVHFPSIVVASFGDPDTRTSETHFIKAPGGDLDLGKLHQVHLIYKAVVHDELDAADGTRMMHALLHSEREYKLWHRMIMAFLSCGLIAPMGFGGSFIDGIAAGVLGTMLSFLQLHVATRSAMYSNVFEISIATIISFAARGLSVSGYFCYGAVASAGVCLILPGYTILCGALELASKNIVAGSVRMVYAIIYSLFLGFGITIGSDMFYVVDPPARRAAETLMSFASFTTVSGSFTSNELSPLDAAADPLLRLGTQLGWNGTFTFSNATTDQILASLQQGSITCPREADWPWWRQSMPPLYLLGLVPLYSALTALWSFQPLRSKELPVMVFISSAGYFANELANKFIFDRSDVVSAIGAFVIGILGNIYSRVFGGTAFTSMVPGVLFLVPSGISAAGGLAMSSANDAHEDSYSQGLVIGFRMVQVAIGITVGLFGSGFSIYSFGRKKHAALFAF